MGNKIKRFCSFAGSYVTFTETFSRFSLIYKVMLMHNKEEHGKANCDGIKFISVVLFSFGY